MTRQNPAKVTVLYDGACPLCRREIAHYRRIDRNGRIVWMDIANRPEVAEDFGLDWDTAMQKLHVLGADGRWHTGVDAFAALWSELPYYRRLAPVARLPLVRPALEWGYRLFARWRYRRRCGIGEDAGDNGASCRVRREQTTDNGIDGGSRRFSDARYVAHTNRDKGKVTSKTPALLSIAQDGAKVQT